MILPCEASVAFNYSPRPMDAGRGRRRQDDAGGRRRPDGQHVDGRGHCRRMDAGLVSVGKLAVVTDRPAESR
jgi:hypothetical protein